MANLKELCDQLRTISADQENTNKRISLTFEILELYCTLTNPNKNDEGNCCYAAVILCGIVQKKLGHRAQKFLNAYRDILPERAITLLKGNIIRMEGY
jgi:hypothetical protein